MSTYSILYRRDSKKAEQQARGSLRLLADVVRVGLEELGCLHLGALGHYERRRRRVARQQAVLALVGAYAVLDVVGRLESGGGQGQARGQLDHVARRRLVVQVMVLLVEAVVVVVVVAAVAVAGGRGVRVGRAQLGQLHGRPVHGRRGRGAVAGRVVRQPGQMEGRQGRVVGRGHHVRWRRVAGRGRLGPGSVETGGRVAVRGAVGRVAGRVEGGSGAVARGQVARAGVVGRGRQRGRGSGEDGSGEGRVGVHRVRPDEGHTLALVLHATVLEPDLEEQRNCWLEIYLLCFNQMLFCY